MTRIVGWSIYFPIAGPVAPRQGGVMRSNFFSCLIAVAPAILLVFSASAQQAAPPPAVLVQPAELRSMTKQAEFVGRAEALEKVDLRARVQGFLGARLFKDG